MSLSPNLFLKQELEKRKTKNSQYSLRAFARDLDISKTTLSEILTGKRLITPPNLEKIRERLALNDAEYLDLKKHVGLVEVIERNMLQKNELKIIENWYMMAILNLAKLPKAKYCSTWIAQRLNISKEEAIEALEILCDKELIINNNGILTRTPIALTTTVDIPSESIKEHHRQSIEKSLTALTQLDPKERDFTTVTYAFNEEDIPHIKEEILHFHRKLGAKFDLKKPNRVYRLNIQFFPLSKPQDILEE